MEGHHNHLRWGEMLEIPYEILLFLPKIDVHVWCMRVVMHQSNARGRCIIIREGHAQPSVTGKTIHLHLHTLPLRVFYKPFLRLLPFELGTQENKCSRSGVTVTVVLISVPWNIST